MKRKLVISLTLIIILTSFITKSFAEELNDLFNKQNELKEQKNDAVTKLEIVQGTMSELLEQVQELSQDINNYTDQISSLEQNIVELQDSITNLEERLDKAQKEYDIKKKTIDSRLLAMYRSGKTTYLDVLLNSKSFSELLSNYYLIALLTDYDTRFLAEIEEKKESIIKNKEDLEKNRKIIEHKREEKETTAIILQNTITIKNNYMTKLSEEERTLQEAIDTYQAELKEVEADIMKATLENLGPEYIGGIMSWPVPGYTVITSQYGMREHPITGIYKLHTGVDIRAPIGANFIAANSGVVVKVSEGGAYGKMVMINHGGGVSTLYAHGSEILVENGQTVMQGEPILKVGSTGYSTGPHAHFEVRVNGFPTNPIPYITSINSNDKTNENNTTTDE